MIFMQINRIGPKRTGQLDSFGYQLTDVEYLGFINVIGFYQGKVLDAANDVCTPMTCVNKGQKRIPAFSDFAGPQFGQCGFTGAQHHLQQVVEIVGHASSHLTDRGQPFISNQRFFHPLSGADVPCDAENRRFVPKLDEPGMKLERDNLVRTGKHFKFTLNGFAGANLLPDATQQSVLGRTDNVTKRELHQLIAIVFQPFTRHIVGFQEIPLGMADKYRIGHILKKLFVAEQRLYFFAFGNVSYQCDKIFVALNIHHRSGHLGVHQRA